MKMDWKSYLWDPTDTDQFLEKLRVGMPPLIITVACTGGVSGKEVNPALPETAEEQANSIYEAYKAGAAVVHIHARDPKEGYANASSDPEVYRKINRLVRERCPDIIIANTTGGSMTMSREKARASLEAEPEMASLNCGPFVLSGALRKRQLPLTGRPEDVSLSNSLVAMTVGETELLAAEMKKRAIKPEFEIYHLSMVNQLRNLIRKGLVEPPYSCSLIFGDPIGTVVTAGNLVSMVANLPKNSIFQIIGVAYMQQTATTIGMLMGGNVRVGFEDNVFFRRGEPLQSNAQAVKRIVQLAEILERKVATPKEAREILNLPATSRKW